MRRLTLIDVLEYYDVPQVFTAVDATGTNYLCTLYQQDESAYFYIGVQISQARLMAFIGGQLDLRDAYVHPEVDNALYRVEVRDQEMAAMALLTQEELAEEMLPEAGYYYDAEDLIQEGSSMTDTYQLEVPAHDRITFSTLMSRMGWRASSIRKSINKIALL